ncbi:homeobox-leucine zipper protein HOX9-like [Impatiens glandulifera]|uniref:homeobox-leucine zipper protein HOX9-like n=1 Tax=Impatiens glandulifera TaxID=253017 RepID=UPI001FB04C78|nr:homeobox-leucine zipper protein HOX9-like [Impatiens glandulifera]
MIFATVSISYNCDGVAARAWGLLFLEPNIILEILKDRLSWLLDCWKLEGFGKFPAKIGGIIELIYIQFYASTTVDPASDFWMLRYTSTLDYGTIVVKSHLPSSLFFQELLLENSPGQVADPQFTRAMIMTSGYIIRPIAGAGSSIHIVDHLDLETPIIPDILKPVCESSNLVAQKLTYADRAGRAYMPKDIAL